MLQPCHHPGLVSEANTNTYIWGMQVCILQVQVWPWLIADSEYKHHPGEGPDPRKTVFIGGVPHPMRACELADIMNERFGHVSYAAIVLDTDVNYPKGE